MVRSSACLLLLLAAFAAPAHAQGNDASTSSGTPGSVERGVLMGAGTTDETTTGSSGPKPAAARTAGNQTPSSGDAGSGGSAGDGASPCARIRDATAQAMCRSGRSSADGGGTVGSGG